MFLKKSLDALVIYAVIRCSLSPQEVKTVPMLFTNMVTGDVREQVQTDVYS